MAAVEPIEELQYNVEMASSILVSLTSDDVSGNGRPFLREAFKPTLGDLFTKGALGVGEEHLLSVKLIVTLELLFGWRRRLRRLRWGGDAGGSGLLESVKSTKAVKRRRSEELIIEGVQIHKLQQVQYPTVLITL